VDIFSIASSVQLHRVNCCSNRSSRNNEIVQSQLVDEFNAIDKP
jgi:hypothetical protein